MARTPFGWTVQGEIDEGQAAVIVRIFDEFTRTYLHAGLSEIAEALNVDAIPTQRGGGWHASTVRYILANRRYVEIVGLAAFDAAQSRLVGLRYGPTKG